jgi:hypothetical protein
VTGSSKRKREDEDSLQTGPPGSHTSASREEDGNPLSSEPQPWKALPKNQGIVTNGKGDTSSALEHKQESKSQNGNTSGLEGESLKQSLEDGEDKKKTRKKKERMEKREREGTEERERKRDRRKKKREDKDRAAAEVLIDESHGTSIAGGVRDEPFRRPKKSKFQGEVDIKGGVESNNDNALETTDPSTDRGEQQPPPEASLQSDKDWLRGKTSRLLHLMAEVSHDPTALAPRTEEASEQIPAVQEDGKPIPADDPSANLLAIPENDASAASSRLFVKNIPYTTEESDVDALFSKYGQLLEVRGISLSLISCQCHDVHSIGTADA